MPERAAPDKFQTERAWKAPDGSQGLPEHPGIEQEETASGAVSETSGNARAFLFLIPMISPGSITAVSEVALWVEDLVTAVAFYRDRLGFEIESIDPGRNAFLKSGDFLLVLFNPKDPGTALADEYLARTGGPMGGLYHVAFKVDPRKLDDMGAGLRDDGLAVKGPVEFATGRRSYFFDDPDGHYIELTDR